MRENLGFDYLKLIQSQIDKYDDLSFKIKTWAITVWVGLLGWAFKTEGEELILLSVAVIVIFWVLDAVNKNFRQDYKEIRIKMLEALNKDIEVNLEFPKHKVASILKQLFKPHLFLVYFSLLILSFLAYF